MSTEGASGFRIGGVDKVMQHYSDSYPSRLGEAVVDGVVLFDDDRLARAAQRLVLVLGHEHPPRDLIERYRSFSYIPDD